MNAVTIERWIQNLGRSYDALISDGLISSQPLQALYEGRERLCIEPVDGIEMSFWAETKCFETLFVTLIKTTPSTVEYRGELPKPFVPVMNKAGVRECFGEPMESRGPVKMPKPVGMSGGWDAYQLDSSIHPGAKVVFKYTAASTVETLVFTLINKSHG